MKQKKMTNSNSNGKGNNFLKGFNITGSSGSYTRLKSGDNKIRILFDETYVESIHGWKEFKDNEPRRYRDHEKPDRSIDPERPMKQFAAFKVFNWREKRVEVFEITQKGILKAIKSFSESPDWGSPCAYDVVITKSGEGLETKYLVQAIPPKPLPQEVIEANKATPVDLESLFSGSSPFDVGTVSKETEE